MVLRDVQIRREVASGIRPAPGNFEVPSTPAYPKYALPDDGAVFAAPAAAGKVSGGPRNPQAVGTNFAGVSLQNVIDAGFGTPIPPDPTGAVGPGHYMQMVNNAVAVYTKAGALVAGYPVSLTSFFTTGASPRGGAYRPRVIFDRRSGKWFACALEVNGGAANHVILAVSRTSDPTGTWSKFVLAVGAGATRTDWPMLGTDDNGVYLGVQMVPGAGTPYPKVAATRKASLIAATPSLSTVYQWNVDPDIMGAPVPAHNLDAVAASDYAWFVGSSSTVFANVQYMSLQWPASPLPPTISLVSTLGTAGYGAPLNAPQDGSATLVDVGLDYITAAITRAGRLWTTRTIGTTATGGASPVDRTGCEWFSLDVTGAVPSVAQTGRIYDNAGAGPLFFYYPSICPTGQGHAAVAFSGSNAASFVSAYTCGRLASDAANTMQAVTRIHEGTAEYVRLDGGGRNRWGEYSAMSLDPNDDQSLWTVQSFASDTAGTPNIWGTWISRLLAPAPLLNNPGASAVAGVSGITINLTGSRFFDPGAAWANRPTATVSGDGISNLVFTYLSTTTARIVFDTSEDSTPGLRDITFTNPDGQTSTAVGGFDMLPNIATTLVVPDVTGKVRETVSLTATLTETVSGAPLAGKTVAFKVAGTSVGTATTDAAGLATLAYLIPDSTSVGPEEIKGQFAFDGTNHSALGLGTLTVEKGDTRTFSSAISGAIGQTVQLRGWVWGLPGNVPQSGVTIDFTLDGTAVGTATTDATGRALLNYKIQESDVPGPHSIGVAFAGDADNNPSSGTGTLTVTKANTSIFVVNRTANPGDSIPVRGQLRRTTDSAVLVGKTLDMSVDGTGIGSSVTDGTGYAGVAYVVPVGAAPGDYVLGVSFAGDALYNAKSSTGTLHVLGTSTLVVDPASGSILATVNLSGTLTRDYDGAPLVGKSVDMKINGTLVGSGVTNASGVVSVAYAIVDGPASRTIMGIFAGDADYHGATDTDTLTLVPVATKGTALNRTAGVGALAPLKAYLWRASDNAPIPGRTLTFAVDGSGVGSAVTAANGAAERSWLVPEGTVGGHSYTATFVSDGVYLGRVSTATLTVTKGTTTLWALPRTSSPTYTTQLAGFLRKPSGAWFAGQTVDFKVDGTPVGSSVTSAAGRANLNYAVPLGTSMGDHPYTAEYAGDANYNGSVGSAALTIQPANTAVTVSSRTGSAGLTYNLVAWLRTVTGTFIDGETLNFSVDGTPVGSGVTGTGGSPGRVNLPYTIPAGTPAGAYPITVDFAGTAVFNPSTGSGTLTVL